MVFISKAKQLLTVTDMENERCQNCVKVGRYENDSQFFLVEAVVSQNLKQRRPGALIGTLLL